MGDPEWLPMKLEEGEAKEYAVEESQLADALAAFAQDRTARTYFGNYARSFGGFKAWLVLRILRLTYH